MILEKKLIEKQKNKKNSIQIEHNEQSNQKTQKKICEEEKEKNQSKMDSWKENKENNSRYKRSKYKGYNYNFNYNNNNQFFYKNKKHYKDFKDYKTNNYIHNHRKNYVEKEIELNSKGETEGDSELKTSEAGEENIREGSLDSNHKSNLDFNNQENTEELNSLENLNIDLMKSQIEDLSYKNEFDFHDIGIKLFPGVFRYDKKKSYEQYKGNVDLYINKNFLDESKKEKTSVFNFDNKNKNDIECNNYLCKVNCNNIKSEQKIGLALAIDYYSSFLEDKIK